MPNVQKQSGNKFKAIPKFGMPMEEFKSLLNKDERVPRLTDKRSVIKAVQAKLE